MQPWARRREQFCTLNMSNKQKYTGKLIGFVHIKCRTAHVSWPMVAQYFGVKLIPTMGQETWPVLQFIWTDSINLLVIFWFIWHVSYSKGPLSLNLFVFTTAGIKCFYATVKCLPVFHCSEVYLFFYIKLYISLRWRILLADPVCFSRVWSLYFGVLKYSCQTESATGTFCPFLVLKPDWYQLGLSANEIEPNLS